MAQTKSNTKDNESYHFKPSKIDRMHIDNISGRHPSFDGSITLIIRHALACCDFSEQTYEQVTSVLSE